MRLVFPAIAAGFITAVLGVVAWQVVDSGTGGGAEAEQEITRMKMFIYRLPLGEDEHPSVRMDRYDAVALVRIESKGESAWSTESGAFESPEPGVMPGVIYTTVRVQVEEYIKGAGDDTRNVAFIGGVSDGIGMDWRIPVDEDDRAVLFLNEFQRGEGLIAHNAYLFDGDTATSELDHKTLSVAELLDGLREAAAADSD